MTNLVNGIAVDSLKIETFMGIAFPCPSNTIGVIKIKNIGILFIALISINNM